MRVRLAVAIAGISALVSIVAGLVVYQRVSVDRYAQARTGAVESAQALSLVRMRGMSSAAPKAVPRRRQNVILANADLPVAALTAGGLLLVVQSLQATSRTRRRRGLGECALLLCGGAAIK
jgi:hypothetical protein